MTVAGASMGKDRLARLLLIVVEPTQAGYPARL